MKLSSKTMNQHVNQMTFDVNRYCNQNDISHQSTDSWPGHNMNQVIGFKHMQNSLRTETRFT